MAIELVRKPNKPAAISMVVNATVIFLVWLVFLLASTSNPLSGLNPVHGFLTWFTAAVPAAVMIVANLTLARQLWRGGLGSPHD